MKRSGSTEDLGFERQAWNISKLVNHVPPLRGFVRDANAVPRLTLHFVQGKRGGLRCFVPVGTGFLKAGHRRTNSPRGGPSW
jgi:hypothetical protein